ncbi:SGNH/GDSL hydrolase family protein [Porifericola rhodea]|uniref:SGNH/GDSL hydrolase family protein n=1 Tax=Porifericola rhodea TaxID=930972 RepID=UPI002665C65A|nr:SGNH/GDSL hydrolase family protein [Porifericola rhodea]WKN30726.1 SGNH/GDSL hydrolase family protein [Porifericola rhodea]
MNRRDFLAQTTKASLVLASTYSSFTIPQISLNSGWNGKTVLFIGDSITQAGTYINFVESWLQSRYPEQEFDIFNLGLGSETISGLTEEGHPYPRPYAHDRLQKVFESIKPDKVFACYGMNCAIYHPFDTARFKKYQQGIEKLIDLADSHQAELTLMTPPPFALQVNDWDKALKDTKRTDYGYAQPYEAYDEVLRRYGDWILNLKGQQSIDLHEPMLKFAHLSYGKDVVHPNLFGHQLMAYTILKSLGELPQKTIKLSASWKPVNGEARCEMQFNRPRFGHVQLSDNSDYNQLLGGMQQLVLKVNSCPEGNYQLFDGDYYLAQFSSDELRNGVNINPLENHSLFDKTSFARQQKDSFALITAKREICDYAWLQHIGHKRPMSRQGIPIALAEAKRLVLNQKIRLINSAEHWKPELIQLT